MSAPHHTILAIAESNSFNFNSIFYPFRYPILDTTDNKNMINPDLIDDILLSKINKNINTLKEIYEEDTIFWILIYINKYKYKRVFIILIILFFNLKILQN